MGAVRKWDYKGTKKPMSIRLSEHERALILKEYESIQSFIQAAMKMLIKAK